MAPPRRCLRGRKAKTCASQRRAGKISRQHREDEADLAREERMTPVPGVRGLWGSARPGPSPHQHTCASYLGFLPTSLHSFHSTFSVSVFLCLVTQKPLTRTYAQVTTGPRRKSETASLIPLCCRNAAAELNEQPTRRLSGNKSMGNGAHRRTD